MNRLLVVLAGALTAGMSASPALAQLQWQSTGVQQASHVSPRPPAPQRPVARKRPVAKAPTSVRPSATEATSPQRVVQAAAVAPAPRAGAATTPAIRYDAAVEPVYHDGYDMVGGEGGMPCGCGEPTCGFGGCCGECVEPACGLTYGEPCGCGDIGCAGGCGSACGCGDVCGCDDGGVPILLRVPPLKELTFDLGVQAFKSPLDAGRDRGNFGVNYGVNAGGKMTLFGLPGLGYQIGYRGVSSQLNGTQQPGSVDSHTQQFFTTGLFHRKAVGLQYGVVYDLLRDERHQSVDFGQVRGLISVTNPRGHEIGFQFASGHSSNTINIAGVGNVTYETTDQYLLFYRFHGCEGGEFRVFGGFDDDDKGIVGADFNLPLTDRFALATGFTYVIPEGEGAAGSGEETWNLGMNLVWHYGCRARRSARAPYRPMFNVADNGSLIIDNR